MPPKTSLILRQKELPLLEDIFYQEYQNANYFFCSGTQSTDLESETYTSSPSPWAEEGWGGGGKNSAGKRGLSIMTSSPKNPSH
jgi:hypothetical protein